MSRILGIANEMQICHLITHESVAGVLRKILKRNIHNGELENVS